MDTLSTSIPTFILPKSNLHHHHRRRRPPSLSSSTTTTTSKTTKLSNKTTTHKGHNNFLPPHITSSPPPKHSSSTSTSSPQPEVTHRKVSTGYAVALLDAARRRNAVDAVRRDVRRLAKWLRDDHLRRVMADPSVEMVTKGEIVKEVARESGLEKLVVKLVKLLAEKCRVDLVGEVLSEFGRIYDELVLIPSVNQIFEKVTVIDPRFVY